MNEAKTLGELKKSGVAVLSVRDEMRKVAWPKWPEVRSFSWIVLTTVLIYTAFVFGLDSLFGVLSGWLYDN